jgi:eukaryotic-like serine/threonine-protein kinase
MDAHAVLAGRYELLDRLGRGGMSVVWRARDRVLGRDVAVKVMAVSGAASRESIRAEALASARIAHPHVAKVFDYGEADDQSGRRVPFIVGELLNGTPLSEVDTPMPSQRALQIGAEVAAGLAAAHAKGVVHCDVKPSNVMLTADGAQVFDFGIAAIVAASRDRASDGLVLGTPTYLAPEQLTAGRLTAATDVYALGILLYGLLTGGAPWSASTEAAMAAAHLVDDPADLPVRDGVTTTVADLYRRCLDRDPALRPTASEASAVLAAAARSHQLLSTPMWIVEKWRTAVLVVSGLVTVAAATTVLPGGPGQASGTLTRLREDDVASTAGATSPVDATPSAASPAVASTSSTSTFSSAGGVVVAACYDDRAYLLSWVPVAGYRVKKLVQGPTATASIELKTAGAEIVMSVACRSGEPVVTIAG